MFYPPIKHFSYWLPFPLGYFISNNNIMQKTLFPCQIVLEKWSKMSWKSWKCPGIPVGKKSGHPAGKKRDTYDDVSDDFSQIVSSRGSNVPNMLIRTLVSHVMTYCPQTSNIKVVQEEMNITIRIYPFQTRVREDKNTSDNSDVSPGITHNRVVEARPTNKDLAGYSDLSQNSSTQASTSAGLGEPTNTSAQNVNESPLLFSKCKL